LGWRPPSLLSSIRRERQVDEISVIHSTHPDSMRTAEEVRKELRPLGIGMETVTLEDPFDFLGVAHRIMEVHTSSLERGDTVLHMNISGGTKAMSCAAMFVGIIRSLPLVYFHEETYEPVAIPTFEVNYRELIPRAQREIVELVSERGPMSQVDIARLLDKKKATISQQIKELEATGAIIKTREGSRTLISIRPGMELLFGVGT